MNKKFLILGLVFSVLFIATGCSVVNKRTEAENEVLRMDVFRAGESREQKTK